jgi:hypothetical protein
MYKDKYIFYYYACFSIEKRNFGLYVKKIPPSEISEGGERIICMNYFSSQVYLK